jgi:ribosomal protein S18 acetylase RimI-like enzyme
MAAIPGWRLRAPALADADDITRIIRDANTHVTGEPDYDASDLAAEWGLAGFDLDRHALVAELPGGPLAAYGWFRARRPHADYDAGYSIHPGHADPALERAVLEELEHRVRADAASGRTTERQLFHVHANEKESERVALYEACGFNPCRWYYDMGVNLKAAPARVTPPPEGIEIRPCRRGIDEPLFHAVLSDAFRGHYRFAPLECDDWVKRHAGYDFYVPDLWLMAWRGDEPVGAASNLLYPDVGYVDELGVREDWRGKRLGRALLDATFAAFWKHGQPRVRLNVDSGNATGAPQLYERAGMSVLESYVLCVKEIGAGA